MAQFQAQVPHPLRHDLPDFLPTRSVRTPTIRVLLLVFIGQSRLKGTAMQIQLDDIDSRERLLRQAGEEEFIDDARTREAHPALLFAGWMGRHHHAAALAGRSYRHSGAVVEGAGDLAFGTTLVLIGGRCKRA